VAEQHLGKVVQCGRCRRSFATRVDPAPVTRVEALRLDIAVATSPSYEQGLWVQHQVACNLDKRQEQAGLILASDPLVRSLGAQLLPGVANTDAEQAVAAVLRAADRGQLDTWACVVVIHEGEAHLGQIGGVHLHHCRAGRLVPITLQPGVSRLKLAAGDWLLLVDGELAPSALPKEMAAASAEQLAQQLVGDTSAVLAVRCY
jgi:hypothetical protein